MRLGREQDFVDKPLAALCTEDLQDYITDRLAEVAPATVDRDLDVISQVLRYADDVWKIASTESPFKGLRRPKYFNERDRRFAEGEEVRLLTALAECRNPIRPQRSNTAEYTGKLQSYVALHPVGQVAHSQPRRLR